MGEPAVVQSKADTYQKGDRVFAKLKGYPPWPAQVQERLPGKEEKYFIHFYGTHDSSQVKLQAMYPYTDETIAKYGKPSKPSLLYKKAMEEIESNVEIYVQANEVLESPQRGTADGTEEGELLIDETPPPVLKREGKLPAPRSAPKEPIAKQPPRRLSKATKRDSFSLTSGSSLSSPVVDATPPSVPQPEIISRSGRKIKPKRFADDEIGQPVSILAKAALQSSFEEGKSDSGPSSAKRAKRQKAVVASPAGPAPVLSEPAPILPPKPSKPEPETRVKTLNVIRPVVSKSSTTDLSSNVPLRTKAAPASSVQAPSSLSIPIESPAHSESESDTAGLSKADEEEPNEYFLEEENNGDAGDIEDKENSTGSWVNHVRGGEEDSASDDSLSCKNENIKTFTEIPVSPDESSGEPFKVSCVKKDTEAELFFNPKKAQELRTASVSFDLESAKICLKLRHTLENEEPAAVELFNLLADSVVKKDDEMREIFEKTMREKRAEKLKKLRLEGEVIEIVGDIINCLNAKSADCYRAIELLDRLANHDLTTLILKKHPEVVETIRKLRYYEGNSDAWDLTPEELEEFNEKAFLIREKAQSIYDSFKLLFCPTVDKSFRMCYEEELERFREFCSHMPPTDFLHMTDEPSSVAEDVAAENGEMDDAVVDEGDEDEPEGEPDEPMEHEENYTDDEDDVDDAEEDPTGDLGEVSDENDMNEEDLDNGSINDSRSDTGLGSESESYAE